MALKQGQHSRIVKMAYNMEIPVHYDREVERYTVTPDQMERLLMLATMSENPFESETNDA